MIQAIVQFHPQVYSGPLRRRLVAHTAAATETIANKPTMAVFSAGVVFMAKALMAQQATTQPLLVASGLGAQFELGYWRTDLGIDVCQGLSHLVAQQVFIPELKQNSTSFAVGVP